MDRRGPDEQHARERAMERYGIDLGDPRVHQEIISILNHCRWVPLAMRADRMRAIFKYEDQFVVVVFVVEGPGLVTFPPPEEEYLTPEQFERIRKQFPEFAGCGEAAASPAVLAPARPQPTAPKLAPEERSFFDSVVLPRFGMDKKKALLWWYTPNHELCAQKPGELAAAGKLAKLEEYLERARREGHSLRIPKRKSSAKSDCTQCRGYPPPGMDCRCECV